MTKLTPTSFLLCHYCQTVEQQQRSQAAAASKRHEEKKISGKWYIYPFQMNRLYPHRQNEYGEGAGEAGSNGMVTSRGSDNAMKLTDTLPNMCCNQPC